jgi:hypothetical protein
LFSRRRSGDAKVVFSVRNLVVVTVKNTRKHCRAVSNDFELCAGVLGKVDIVDKDEVFVPVFFVVADVVEVFCGCDSVWVVRLTHPAAVLTQNISHQTRSRALAHHQYRCCTQSHPAIGMHAHSLFLSRSPASSPERVSTAPSWRVRMSQ